MIAHLRHVLHTSMLRAGMHVTAMSVGCALCCALCCALLAPHAHAQVVLKRDIVATGLTQPTTIASSPGDATRMYVCEKAGRIRVVDIVAGQTLPAPFLQVTNVLFDSERGLIGLAFHPNYASNGVFYFTYIRSAPNNTGEWVLAQGRRSATDPNVAEATYTDVLVVSDAASFHQSGWIGFGPDGFLYATLGDNTVLPSGIQLTTLRSKILRLDVDGPDNIPANADDDSFPADPLKNYSIPPTNPLVGIEGEDEIWATGIRNAWRCSFDRQTGDLWVGDVGWENREEVTMLPAGLGGRSLGWPCIEGFRPLISCLPVLPYTPPLFDYGFAGGSLPIGSQDAAGFRFVVGGYVYRGNDIPCLRGTYIFADGATGIYSIRRGPNNTVLDLVDRRPETSGIRPTCFGESATGELYGCHIGDPFLYKLSFDVFAGPDCDNNGIPDKCEIDQGWTTDSNNNGLPDRCEGLCTDIDFNNDGLFPDTLDIDALLTLFSGAPCPTERCDSIDFNNDGLFPDTQDIDSFLSVFGGGPCL
jgi:hypothetical protein